jgi:MYXO-CTERM domain-containing protein
VADVQAAFDAPLRRYRVAGETHFAMLGAPRVPAQLADVVAAVHNTHDFYPRPASRLGTLAPDYQDPKHGDGLAPPDWATIYDVAPLYASGVSGAPLDGTGVTIAVVGIADIAQSDVDAFRTKFNLGATHLVKTLVPGTGAPSGFTGAGSEAILDVEWSGGIAKGATIDYVYTGGDDANVDDATYYAIEQNLGSVLSESWGGCEQGLSPADQDVYEIYGSAANLLGMTYLASTGDSGGAGCIYGGAGATGLYVEMPASYPGVTAVGGTAFPKGTLVYDASGNVTGYSTGEEAWTGGGGGISSVFTRPAYQAGLPTCAIVGSLPTMVTASTMREIPDIAASAGGGGANPYFIECTTGGGDCGDVGGNPHVMTIIGTSASTPSIAGVIAIVDQAVGQRLGNVNPLLYALEAGAPSAFHDIAIGGNLQGCSYPGDTGCPSSGGQYGYSAATGYDCTTGVGTPDATAFAKAVASMTPTTTTVAAMPTSTTEGGMVTLSATVTVDGANANALTGAVTFAFESYTKTGGPDLSWTLGEAAITMGSTTGGAAALGPAMIPVGLANPAAQYVDVIATYGGDATHLPSRSKLARITVADFAFAVAPATASVVNGGTVAFSTTGGVPPVRWFLASDGTCDQQNVCSQIDEQSGAFKGGPIAGYVIVQAIDTDGADALAYVTVGTPGFPPPWDPDASVPDAGVDAPPADDAGDASTDAASATDGAPRDASPADASHDGPSPDAGKSSPPGSSDGCGCELPSQSRARGEAAWMLLALAGVAATRRRAR